LPAHAVDSTMVAVSQVPSLQRPVAFAGGASETRAAAGSGSARIAAGLVGAARTAGVSITGAGVVAVGRTLSTGALAVGIGRTPLSDCAARSACVRVRGATDEGGGLGDFRWISAGVLSAGATAAAGGAGRFAGDWAAVRVGSAQSAAAKAAVRDARKSMLVMEPPLSTED
jgi:hypothetical protein